MLDNIKQNVYNEIEHMFRLMANAIGDWSSGGRRGDQAEEAVTRRAKWFDNLSTSERLHQSVQDEREITTALLLRSLHATLTLADLLARRQSTGEGAASPAGKTGAAAPDRR